METGSLNESPHPSSHDRMLARGSQELNLTRTTVVVARLEIVFKNINIYKIL
jgi:hypothetical protein